MPRRLVTPSATSQNKMPAKTTRNIFKTIAEERKERERKAKEAAQAAQDEKDRRQREFEQKKHPRGEVKGKTVVPQPRQKERGGREDKNISKKDFSVFDFNEKDHPPAPPAPKRIRRNTPLPIFPSQADKKGTEDRAREARRARRSIDRRGVPADEAGGGMADEEPPIVNDHEEKDPVLPDLTKVVDFVDGPYRALENYNPGDEMKTIHKELKENIKTKATWYKWTNLQMRKWITRMIRACYTAPVDFHAKYDPQLGNNDLTRYVITALFKNLDTRHCFESANKWLDLLRDNKVAAFKEKVEKAQTPPLNAEELQAEVVEQWLLLPFFIKRIPRIADDLDEGFAAWDNEEKKEQKEEKKEDDMQDIGGNNDHIVDDDGKEEDIRGIANPIIRNGKRVKIRAINIGDDEDNGGVIVPANVIHENIDQLGDVINFLWSPLVAANKKTFDDEREKYCKMAAEILANCRWQVSKKRESVDTVMNALSVLRENHIIKGKKFVGPNNTNLKFLERKLNNFNARRNTPAYQEKSNREKRKIESYVGKIRAIKDRMHLERRPDPNANNPVLDLTIP